MVTVTISTQDLFVVFKNSSDVTYLALLFHFIPSFQIAIDFTSVITGCSTVLILNKALTDYV